MRASPPQKGAGSQKFGIARKAVVIGRGSGHFQFQDFSCQISVYSIIIEQMSSKLDMSTMLDENRETNHCP